MIPNLEHKKLYLQAMSKLRIQFINPEKVKDQKILDAISDSVIKGTPRAESQAIRARVPNVFWSFQNTWNGVFIQGKVDHNLKELCRVYVSKSVQCKILRQPEEFKICR